MGISYYFTGGNTKQVIKGVFQCGSQYHFTMETQSCVCIPVEDGMNVYPTSQYGSHSSIDCKLSQC